MTQTKLPSTFTCTILDEVICERRLVYESLTASSNHHYASVSTSNPPIEESSSYENINPYVNITQAGAGVECSQEEHYEKINQQNQRSHDHHYAALQRVS